jgi:ABC-2 type transport system ATP-binding protein
MPVPAVQARDLVRSYGDRRALDGLSLDVPAGGVFGLLGPNGSGKSTLLGLIASGLHPEAGQLTVLGQPPSRESRRRIGTVFQEDTSDPLMTATEYLALSATVFGVPRSQRAERATALLTTVGLAGRAGDRIATLSGGMRRRVEMARALIHRPHLLLLDEPTTGVDIEERHAIWDALRAAAAPTVLLATNDLAEADAVCDRVAFLRAGRVVATGTPAELKAGLRRDSVQLTWPAASTADLASIGGWPDVGPVAADGDTVSITADRASAVIPRLFALAGDAIRGVTVKPANLEDAYLQAVGREAPR